MYRISSRDVDQAAEVCGRSFIDYPSNEYLIPKKRIRKEKMPHLQKFLMRYSLINSHIYSISKDLEGLIVFCRSDVKPVSMKEQRDIGGMGLINSIGLKTFLRYIKYSTWRENLYQKYKPEDTHINCGLLCVDPDFRKKGFGAMLIKEMINHADKEKLSILLSTHDKTNISFYKRFGFTLIGEDTWKNNKLVNYTLLRTGK